MLYALHLFEIAGYKHLHHSRCFRFEQHESHTYLPYPLSFYAFIITCDNPVLGHPMHPRPRSESF